MPPSPEPAGNQPLTVLFLDHTAKLGGGEIALYHLLLHIDWDHFRPLVVLGEEGPLAQRLRDAEIETLVLPLPNFIADTRKDSLGAGSLLKIKAVGGGIAYAFRIARLIKSRRVALMHTNSLKADIIGGVAAKLARVPVVWHVRDRIEADYLPKPVVMIFRLLCRTVPDFVVANSAATLETIRLPGWAHREVVHSGYPLMSGSSAVVHEGIVRRAAAVKSQPDRILVGLVGRIARWKGQHVFLTAAAEVRKRFPAARFQIIGSAMFGEAEYEREIRELAKKLEIEDCVDFMGFRSDVPALINEFDVLVHASITGEPFGQVVTEAMVVAKPVVATRGGGVPEIVQDGLTGLLVPMNDAPAMAEAVCQLLADPERARQMGLAGRERALRHFTVEGTARRLESVFEKVLDRAGVRYRSRVGRSPQRRGMAAAAAAVNGGSGGVRPEMGRGEAGAE
jgi:glycosyltransferase involved in cell wall biosynthesis